MGYRYAIDLDTQTTTIAFEGTVTPEVISALRAELDENPDFTPEFHLLIDGRGISDLKGMGAEVIRSMARNRGSLRVPGALRAFVLTRDIYYGLSRIFTAIGDRDGDMAVFRNYDDALAWIEENRRGR